LESRWIPSHQINFVRLTTPPPRGIYRPSDILIMYSILCEVSLAHNVGTHENMAVYLELRQKKPAPNNSLHYFTSLGILPHRLLSKRGHRIQQKRYKMHNALQHESFLQQRNTCILREPGSLVLLETNGQCTGPRTTRLN
jgi:hypothetical protein